MLNGIEGVSTYADDVNRAFILVNGITLFLFVVTIGSMLYFVFRYRAKNNPPQKAENIEHYTPIEVAWTVIPTILLMIVFYFGLESMRTQRTMPKDENALVIKVLAQRWSWNFEYENGKKSPTLTIPVNTPIKLKMTAPINDVIHSFYVPAFRVKEDVIPGQTTQVWFNINKKGVYDIQCAEYCGTRHSYMRSKVEVVSKEAYETWLNPPVAKKGEVQETIKAEELFNQYGCVGCHSFDGTILVGPSLKDIYNKPVTLISNGEEKELIRDENYLKDAILDSNKDIVKNFPPNLMPTFKDIIAPHELQILIDYLKGKEQEVQEQAPSTKLDGKEVMQNNGCFGCHSTDGTKIVGPTFKSLYNKKENVQINGSLQEILVDDAYIKTSILQPNAAIVEGFSPGLMPPFENILNEEEINAITEYIKTLK